jgi:hypothetical protein
MQAKTLAAVVVSAVIFAIAGWVVGSKSGTVSILKHSHDQKDCKGKECKVDIKVECSDPGHPTPASCEPYSDKAEVIEVDKDTKAINFEVKTSPFDFNQTDGIKFSSLNDGDKAFACAPQGGSNKKYDCTITSAKPYTLYKYSIHIETLDRTDPWVVNY